MIPPLTKLLRTSVLLVMVCYSVLALQARVSAEDSTDFSREILPLLSENCFQCHGPDEANREADLRLDQHDGALAKLDSGEHAIVPGDSAKSVLLQRIESDDPDLRMPPPDSGKKLSPDEIARLKKWIDEGATWAQHWAFQAPQKAPLPNRVDRLECA